MVSSFMGRVGSSNKPSAKATDETEAALALKELGRSSLEAAAGLAR